MNLAEATVLITGSTDGVGKVVARELAARGARVVLHGRSAEKVAAVRAEIEAATGSPRLESETADLASLAATRGLAQRILARHNRLDLLINNAGVGFGPRGAQHRQESRDGHELRFAVNHLSHFLLTALLLPLLRSSAPARIVNVASAGQQPIDFGDVMLTRGYDGTRAYRQSKLAQVMFTIDLARQLEGSGVTVNCLHPATFMNTRMVLESVGTPMSSVEEGAEAILRLATAPELAAVNGRYFNGKQPARPNAQAEDAAARRRLWRLSLDLTGLVAFG